MKNNFFALFTFGQRRGAAITFLSRLAATVVLAVLVPLAASSSSLATSATEPGFGERLAAAARNQTWVPVIYDPAYRKIDYPGGDVPWYLGVCTDVVVRAYRTLGIDLQVLVHKARVGSGDTNIDHRRVPVLRRYFQRFARSLPTSQQPDAYAPGDIVTYHLPDGRYSKTHIAIVSDRKNGSGTPLIIHNRGWGVSEEDWLFSEKITGHYRFSPDSKTAILEK
ncbi:MAG: DUF1287 domain-containing protein [Hyphomicrobiaceae bacterium]|nr:DUF1287 domain-containing protein [Hyphomicrobiaceae bacterium]